MQRTWLDLKRRPRRLALALQGGGSFGAFTWGVLDRLLEEDRFVLDAVSGTSAGAVNAVLLASGLARGGRAAARETLARFWRRISEAARLPHADALGPFLAAPLAATTGAALELSTRLFSPYQLNPLGLDPLRRILAEEVDFAALRRAAPVRLLIAATRVADGETRIFREAEISLEAVLASACLPFLHHAVAVDEEWYWDGGYSANPPLLPLVEATRARDQLHVELTPRLEAELPRLVPEIAQRVRRLALGVPLRKEIESLAALRAIFRRRGILAGSDGRKIARLRLHCLSAEKAVEDLAAASAFDLGWPFLSRLHAAGREAAEAWLERG